MPAPGTIDAAINALQTFIAAVEAQSGNHIHTEATNVLVADALEIIALLNGSDRMTNHARSDAFRRWQLEI